MKRPKPIQLTNGDVGELLHYLNERTESYRQRVERATPGTDHHATMLHIWESAKRDCENVPKTVEDLSYVLGKLGNMPASTYRDLPAFMAFVEQMEQRFLR